MKKISFKASLSLGLLTMTFSAFIYMKISFWFHVHVWKLFHWIYNARLHFFFRPLKMSPYCPRAHSVPAEESGTICHRCSVDSLSLLSTYFDDFSSPLVFSNLIKIYHVMVFFMWLPRVCWTSWICGVSLYVKFTALSVIFFCSISLLFYYPDCRYNRLLDIVL